LRWLIPEVPEERSSALANALKLHPLVAKILAGRGIATPEAAEAFLSDRLADLPDPFHLKGMASAVELLCWALSHRKRIALYGDYDVDGVCSTALLSLFLRGLGAQVETYIPHRLTEGYGLNEEAVERLAQRGAQLLVTLDCGIASVAEVAKARQLGLKVLVVDHHSVPSSLPDAHAILNPHQPGCSYPTKHLCAAGVAFNLCVALRKRLREGGAFAQSSEPNLKSMLDLVALATIADVVPIVGANRILVRHGLCELQRAHRPGIRALKQVAGLDGDASVSTGQVGFRLAPRINAAGRLLDASLGLQLLTSEDAAQAEPLARALDAANSERQGVEQDILQGAFEQAQSKPEAKGLVLYAQGWHAGVVGIVASRVVEKFHRPTVVVAVNGESGKGSARSIEGFHLVEALSACAHHLEKFGGHRHAAGLSLQAEQLPHFARTFDEVARRVLADSDLLPRCRIDAVVKMSELCDSAASALETLAPFGPGNPEPVLAVRRATAEPRVILSKRPGQDGHLKLAMEGAPEVDAIGFGMASRKTLLEGPVDLAFHLAWDEWNGRRRLQLRLKDVNAS
jgi:single-stranded-DNA-specific exonuclease